MDRRRGLSKPAVPGNGFALPRFGVRVSADTTPVPGACQTRRVTPVAVEWVSLYEKENE